MLATGSPWRDLPERYGPWQTCYERFRRWAQDGTWERIYQTMLGQMQRRHALMRLSLGGEKTSDVRVACDRR